MEINKPQVSIHHGLSEADVMSITAVNKEGTGD